MINKDVAKQIAEDYFRTLYSVPDDELVVLDEHTMERSYGWIFFSNSKRYVETGDYRYLLAGNGPVVVEQDGRVCMLPAALPTEEAIQKYEAGELR